MKKYGNIPDPDHILRHVSPGRTIKDRGDVVGIRHDALRPRNPSEGVSCSWVEYYGCAQSENITKAINATKQSLKIKPNSVFALGNVERIKHACNEMGTKVRIVYMPEELNESHTEVLRIPQDDDVLLEYLASHVWNELYQNMRRCGVD